MKHYQYSILKHLGKELAENTEFTFKIYKYKKSCYSGATLTAIQDKRKTMKRYVKINLSTIEREFKSSDIVFTASLIAIYHEFHHVKQFYDIKNGNASKDLAVSFLASQNNFDFYHDNYLYLIHEIEAEMNGIINTYNYYLNHGLDNDALNLIKSYIRIKIRTDSRYMDRGFDVELINSIYDIKEVFNNVLADCLKHELDLKQIKTAYNKNNILMNEITYDRNIIYKMLLELDNIESQEVKIFTLLESGIEQLKFLCAYTLKEHPTYCRFFSKYQFISFDSYIKSYIQLLLEIKVLYQNENKVLNNQEKRIRYHFLLQQENGYFV